MAELDQYDSETVYLAFWLQDKIYREGIEGVHYMEKAQLWAENNAAEIMADEISDELGKL